MRMISTISLMLSCGWQLVAVPSANAQFWRNGGATDAMADRIRADGSFIQGVGWYNLHTAQAEAIQTETVIKWKEDLRRIQRERRELADRNEAFRKMKAQERIEAMQKLEKQLRTDPTPEDIYRGLALNVLLTDLTDPDITPAHWRAYQVRLPQGVSVKDLVMEFMPSKSDPGGASLSNGVIALARLEIDGKWPTPLMVHGLEDEKKDYEVACRNLRDHLINGNFDVSDITALDRSLDSLKSKIQKVVPTERNYRTEAGWFVDDLRKSSRVFDAKSVDYAREMLVETSKYDAKTVPELVAFTLKYRLKFSSVERSPSGRVLYSELYRAMKEQLALMSASMPALGSNR